MGNSSHFAASIFVASLLAGAYPQGFRSVLADNCFSYSCSVLLAGDAVGLLLLLLLSFVSITVFVRCSVDDDAVRFGGGDGGGVDVCRLGIFDSHKTGE